MYLISSSINYRKWNEYVSVYVSVLQKNSHLLIVSFCLLTDIISLITLFSLYVNTQSYNDLLCTQNMSI